MEPPNGEAKVRVLDVELDPGQEHVLTIDYDLAPATLSFESGGARLAFFMTDLEQRGYLEQRAPANLEFDQHPASVNIRLVGAAKDIICSAMAVRPVRKTAGAFQFPAYFCSSSYYLHLTDRDFHVSEDTFQTGAQRIPIVAYGTRAAETVDAIRIAKKVITELEAEYGAYAHEDLTIYVTDDIDGGMEYCGATMTVLGALEHEITHSWFARGVMPGNGNSGWIDEAIASWRDAGYRSLEPNPRRAPVNLAAFPPYRRHSPSRPIGRAHCCWRRSISCPRATRRRPAPAAARTLRAKAAQADHDRVLQAVPGNPERLDLTAMFDRFVYNKSGPEFVPFDVLAEGRSMTIDAVRELQSAVPHVVRHRPFTRQELNSLR